MAKANLIGEIPEPIGNMTALEVLDLSMNGFTGKIPIGVFMLKNLSKLILYRNMLSAEIPQVVQSLNLPVIDLSQNNLTGTIPNDFGKLENLAGLILMFNQLSGKIPESIGRIPSLTDVRLFNNNLSGALPPDFGRYSALTGFEVAYNNLTGKLPEYFCAGGKLLGLIAFDNNLSGELPESLGNCNSLLTIMIYNNGFSGKIPVGLWTASILSYLWVSDNMFTGELPEKKSGNLSSIDTSNNRFSGKIPAGLSSLRNLQVFRASNNLFAGTVTRELAALPSLTVLWLDQNQLSESLPSNLSTWKKLTTLNLRRNQLSGEIPEEIGSLTVLNSLDSAENKFSGKIPPQLGLLKLTFLNLSSNYFIGEIPTYGKGKHGLNTRTDWNMTKFQDLNFTENDIRPKLTENNVIGSGGSGKVYRVSVNSSGDVVAVKMICNNRKLDQKREKRVLAEVQTLKYSHTTKVNEKTDIYSFGVILLELTTGTEANYGDEHTYLAKWAWRYLQDGNPIVDALDEEIKEACYLDEMSRVFKLGIRCTGTPPAARPSKKSVLEILVNPSVISQAKTAAKSVLVASSLDHAGLRHVVPGDEVRLRVHP
ncbi:hypothetical protein Patl1_07505 [Pistacia atlantica]|uniref:Uncharacterized protein n=1 Tax=Pistacia atlantica TaxID=434234 RepID=A0ACC1AF35_9ROSI|nr:hypothetical protein Patl1_07505 [Pistacia atlantica]